MSYTGVDNLEVMAEAVKYNSYLLGLIRAAAPAHGTILDFGAGSGTFALPVAALGRRVICIEPDDHLRQVLASKGMRTHASLAELVAAQYDYAYSLNVLEHIEDDGQALRELHRVLKPGAPLLLYVPAFACLYTSMDAKVGHRRRYRRATLMRLSTQAGFAVQRAEYVDCLGFFATLLFKLVGNSRGDINRSAIKWYDRIVFPVSCGLDHLFGRIFGKNLLVIAVRQ